MHAFDSPYNLTTISVLPIAFIDLKEKEQNVVRITLERIL